MANTIPSSNSASAPSPAGNGRNTKASLSEFVIDAETGLKRLRYCSELPPRAQKYSRTPWEYYRDRRRYLDSRTLLVPGLQTDASFGMEVKRQYVILMAHFGSWTLGKVVASIRRSEKYGQLSSEEAYSLVGLAFENYCCDFACHAPEVQAIEQRLDEHAHAHGWYDHHEVESAEKDKEALGYKGLPEVKELYQQCERTYRLFEARLANECGETEMAS